MTSYRLYLRDNFAICGRDYFEASDDTEAFSVAEMVAGACSDVCTHFEIWEGPRMVREGRTLSVGPSINLGAVTEQRQQLAIEQELAIKDTKFVVATSRRLLETLAQL